MDWLQYIYSIRDNCFSHTWEACSPFFLIKVWERRVTMTHHALRLDEIKRKLRKLKKHEMRMRFNGLQPRKNLVWDQFFNVRESKKSKAKYSLSQLASLNHDQYVQIIHEYLSYVYYEIYKASGFKVQDGIFDPSILSKLGLPANADEFSVKKRFRELAKKYHPDSGGDAEMFIELMNNYRALLGKDK